jgi:hypothetical protein
VNDIWTVYVNNTGKFLPLLTGSRTVLYSHWCTTGCKGHMNFDDESACLIANNVCNEGRLLTLSTA